MLTGRHGGRRGSWMAAVAPDDLPHLHRFVRGIERDHAAVRGGLTPPYNSGADEGNVNRSKMLKATDAQSDRCTDAPDSISSANEFASVTHTLRNRHGKWDRANSDFQRHLRSWGVAPDGSRGQMTPSANIASATFTNPAMLAPCT